MSAASGAFGRLVLERLSARPGGEEIVAAVRDPGRLGDLAARGVRVRRGDYDDPDTLRTAFAGADRLLLISSPELDTARRIGQHRAAVDAARAAGVGAVVYTSFLGADTGADGLTAAHHATELALASSGLPHTLLRHPFYSEAFLGPALHAAVAAGELADPTGGRGINTASRADLAEAAVRVLTDNQHMGRAYDFTGTRWTYPDLARALSRACGTPVALLPQQDGPGGALGWLYGQVRSGALERHTDDLRDVLGRPPTSLEAAVKAVLAPAPGAAGPA
nr:NAD(P)H-binding protein [Streptomyces zinciresistens]